MSYTLEGGVAAHHDLEGELTVQGFEKLGACYLGRAYDLNAGKAREDLILYDSKDLVTHAVCVGMTGSGKTGLCISLLEEAAIDGAPAIAIDPKGDLSNMLLTFPDLRPGDLVPWVNPEEAGAKGLPVEEYAAQQAEPWRKGPDAPEVFTTRQRRRCW